MNEQLAGKVLRELERELKQDVLCVGFVMSIEVEMPPGTRCLDLMGDCKFLSGDSYCRLFDYPLDVGKSGALKCGDCTRACRAVRTVIYR